MVARMDWGSELEFVKGRATRRGAVAISMTAALENHTDCHRRPDQAAGLRRLKDWIGGPGQLSAS